MPCHTFLAASTMGAWTVHTSSPSQNRSSKWVKEVDAFLYWMEPYSDKEMTALGLIKNLDVERLHKNYRLWGPSARTCITLMDTMRVVAHERSVEVAADEFTSNIRQFANIDEMASSHRLIVAWPTATKRTAYPAFASNYILGFVSRAYAKLDLATRQRFYNAISGHTWFGASAGHIFESGVLLWFRYSRLGSCFRVIPLRST
ncbi:hypothetical protein BJV77DRAFT_182514 [Russula vinacea]|nr:hypothetical protein BJV77DRAFT_182514 [Russula vinacea]